MRRLVCLGLLCSSVVAAMASPKLAPPDQTTDKNQDAWLDNAGITVDLVGGLGIRDMREDSVLSAEMSYQNLSLSPDIQSHWSRGYMSWAAGFDASYPLTPLFSVEGGFMRLGDQRFHVDSGDGVSSSSSFCIGGNCFKSNSYINFSSWFLYGALNGEWSIAPHWFATGKLALLYMITDITIHRINSSDAVVSDSATANHWFPALAVGLKYRFAERWQMTATYWMALSSARLNDDHLFTHRSFSTFDQINMPVWQAVLFGVGYRFSL